MDQTTNFVAGRVRRMLLTRAWFALFVAVIIGLIFGAFANPRTLIRPIQNLGVSTQVTNAQFKKGTIVTLTAPKVVDTGIYYTGTSANHIGAIETKDGFMIIIVSSSKTSVFNQKNVKMTGTVSALDSEISSRISSEARSSAAPVQFNYTSTWVLALVFTWIGAILILLLVIYFISRLTLLGSPERAQAYRQLVKKGSSVSVADLAAKLDEAAANGTVTRVGKTLYFCPEVIAIFGGAIGQLHPTADLLWVYPHVVRRRIYGFIPSGSNWSVVLCFADKRKINATVKNEAAAKGEVQQILGIYPNMLSGYSSDRAAKFQMGRMEDLRAEIAHQVPTPQGPPASDDLNFRDVEVAKAELGTAAAEAQQALHDPALLSGAGTVPSAAVASDTPYEQKQSYYGRGARLTSPTDKETRKDVKALKKQDKVKRTRGELDTSDVSAPPAEMQAEAPQEATAPKEESSFGLGDDEFGGDF